MSPDNKPEPPRKVGPPRTFKAAAQESKILLGVVHLMPLPGSPRYGDEGLERISGRAQADAKRILEAGFDGYLVENFGDVPFFAKEVPPHVTAVMTRIVWELPRKGFLVGVNVLRNDARSALAIAAACDLQMIRVNVHTGAMLTDQGVVEGKAALTLRERNHLAPTVSILADVDVKHATPLGSEFDLTTSAKDTAYRGLADALIVTGESTGAPAPLQDLQEVKNAVPDRPLLVGSGATSESVRDLLQYADGIIVGSALKHGGYAENAVDPDRARKFVQEARA